MKEVNFAALILRHGRRLLAATLMGTTSLALGGALMPMEAHAQAVTTYSIPAGPLATVLNRLADQSGADIVYNGSLTEGLSSSGLSGSFGTAEALSRILAGTGVTFRHNGGNRFTLERAPRSAEGTVQLGPVRVEGDGRSGTARYLTANGATVTERTRSYTTDGPLTAAAGLPLTLRETPQSVSIITRERIDDQALNSLGQILEQIPGLSSTPVGPTIGGFVDVYARGYRVNAYQIDGVNLPANAFSRDGFTGSVSLDTAIFDNVTVVRGATGLLTGAGNPGASISLARKRPTDNLQVGVSLSGGTWNRLRAVGDLSGPVNASGTIRARLIGVYDEGDSWLDRYEGRNSLVYGVVDADLSDRTLLSISAEYGRESASNSGPFSGFLVDFADGTPTPFKRGDNATTNWSRYRSNRSMVSATLDHKFSDDWRGRLTYYHNTREGKPRVGLVTGYLERDGTTTIFLRDDHEKNNVDVIDARVDGQFTLGGRRHNLIIGVNAYDAAARTPRSITNRGFCCTNALNWTGDYPEPDFSTVTSSIPRFDGVVRQAGIYATTRLSLSDRLAVIGGARINWWKSRNVAVDTGALLDDRRENGIVKPYVAATFDLTSNISAYASYTTTFTPQNLEDVNGNTLDPEECTNLELGVKGAWFDGRLNVAAAIFQVRKNNLGVLDNGNLTPDGDDAWRAEDHTRGRGWEIEISGEVLPGLQVQGGYTRFVTKDSTGALLNTEQPRHIVKFFTTWAPVALDSRLKIGGGIRYQSKTYSSYDEEPLLGLLTQRSYAVADALVSYEINQHLSLGVNAANIFDKSYRTDVFSHFYGPPRNFLATLRARY